MEDKECKRSTSGKRQPTAARAFGHLHELFIYAKSDLKWGTYFLVGSLLFIKDLLRQTLPGEVAAPCEAAHLGLGVPAAVVVRDGRVVYTVNTAVL